MLKLLSQFNIYLFLKINLLEKRVAIWESGNQVVLPVGYYSDMCSPFAFGERKKKGGELKLYIKCPNCGYEGKGKRMIKGSIILEIGLWILLIVPGLIYSIWRSTSRYIGCPKCGFKFVVKVKKEEITQKM